VRGEGEPTAYLRRILDYEALRRDIREKYRYSPPGVYRLGVAIIPGGSALITLEKVRP